MADDASSLLDAALVAEEAGRHLASAPLIESVVAARLLAELGGEGLAWCERIVAGEAIVVLALHEAGIRPEQLVPGAAIADGILYLDEDEVVLLAGTPSKATPDNLGRAPRARRCSASTSRPASPRRRGWPWRPDGRPPRPSRSSGLSSKRNAPRTRRGE